MELGAFLKWILDRIYSLWPFRIVSDWEQGVLVSAGRVSKLLTSANGIGSTGLHWFLPLLEEIFTEDANVRTQETDIQDLLTRDRRALSFSLSVKWQVIDLTRMYTTIHEPADTIHNAVEATAAAEVMLNNFDDLDETFGDTVHAQVIEELDGWGIELIEVGVISFTTAQPIRLVT